LENNINRFHFFNELIISTQYDRTQDKYGNISWTKSSKFLHNEDELLESLEIKQIFCDGDGSYTAVAEYTVMSYMITFSPFGSLKNIYEMCEKFKQFFLTL
jgi:hypothetical protein